MYAPIGTLLLAASALAIPFPDEDKPTADGKDNATPAPTSISTSATPAPSSSKSASPAPPSPAPPSKDIEPCLPDTAWELQTLVQGESWFDNWWWFSDNDPTAGKVNYVDMWTARERNLSWTEGTKFGMQTDSWTQNVDPNARGRDSVRIQSNEVYNEFIAILDVEHMPVGCPTWPAFWSLGDGAAWPEVGEIDVIEGTGANANRSTTGQLTLHTAEKYNCSFSANRTKTFDGRQGRESCRYGAGCSVFPDNADKDKSFGLPFNAAGGGWYAMKRDRYGISMWFFPRDGGDSVPAPFREGWDNFSVQQLGTPTADFRNSDGTCDLNAAMHAPQRLIINLTVCGRWANARWPSMGCSYLGDDCNEIAMNNAEVFKEAYWKINGLRVYKPVGGSWDYTQPLPLAA